MIKLALAALVTATPALADDQIDGLVFALDSACIPMVKSGALPIEALDEIPSFMASNFLKAASIKGRAFRQKGLGSVSILVSTETDLCAVVTQQADMAAAYTALSAWQVTRGFDGALPDMTQDETTTLTGDGLQVAASVLPGNGQIELRGVGRLKAGVGQPHLEFAGFQFGLGFGEGLAAGGDVAFNHGSDD